MAPAGRRGLGEDVQFADVDGLSALQSTTPCEARGPQSSLASRQVPQDETGFALELRLEALDANGNGTPEIADAVYLLTKRFRGGPAPPAPFPACGTATTP